MDIPEPDEASIFNEARHIHAPQARRLYLENTCGQNRSLLARVQALLRVHDEERSFLELPVGEALSLAERAIFPGDLAGPGLADGPSDHGAGEGAGSIIAGRYKLLELLGQGGMGAVFMAQQTAPVKRLVAVKLILQGMDSRQVLARFEVERQALALMDHPHIAKVLDAGATDSGRPFFVMELVKGVPITRFCDERRLTPRERLELFIPVCQAIQHAHQKGIIHRDIKPSNVLVALYDDRPVPKVIDFGVAKATGPQLTDASLMTGFGMIVGTPEYMSPEQAQLNQLDIDTRSDVYSLGVLLYELLTGMTPIDRKRLGQSSLLEMLRVIREEESPRPSVRLSTAETLPSIAATRGTEPARLTRLLRGELDWIVMKCLEKDRSRRYETASGLARDLERFLRREPVMARAPSTAYRLRKFVQRHRTAVLAVAAVLGALLAGVVVASWQAVTATRAKQEAVAAAAAEREAREAAQAKETETRAVLDFVENKVIAAARPKGQQGGIGANVTVHQALLAALPFVAERFKDQPLIEARVRMSLGTSFRFLGDAKAAAQQHEIARALYVRHRGLDDRDTLESMNQLAESYRIMGRYGEALQLNQETLEHRQANLGPNHPDTLTSMHNLAICYWSLGRLAEALQLKKDTLERRQAQLGVDHPDTLTDMNNLAVCYLTMGRNLDALPLLQKTFALMKARLGPDHPDTLMTMSNVAATLLELRRYAEALPLTEEALVRRKTQLGADHPETLEGMINLGICYRGLGRNDEARKIFEKTFALEKAKLGPDHTDTLESMHQLACTRFALGQHANALKLYDEALALRKAKFGADHPEVHRCIREMAGFRLHYFQKTGDAAGCRAMAEMCEKLQPTDPAGCYDVACYRAVTAAVLRAGGKPADATQADAEAARAMTWLKQGVAAGYKDAAQMKRDTDLDSLRARADFRKLLRDLEGPGPP